MRQTDKQSEYRRKATHRWNIKSGATRAGKTYGDYWLIPKRIIERSGKEGIYVILGNTKGTIQRNIIEPMQEIWGANMVSNIRSDNSAFMFGERVFCLGADNAKYVNRIRGAGIKYCYGDEMTTWAEEVFSMLKSRLDKPYSIFDGTCNPSHPKHWVKEFLESNADIYLQEYVIDDNPELDPDFVEQLKLEYANTVYYDRYILGKWTAAEGAVYKLFADDQSRFVVDNDWLEKHPISVAVIGVDFGGNGSGHAFSCTGFERGFTGLVTLAEWYHKGEITPEKLEREFVDFARMCIKLYGARQAYCDSAETTLIMGLRNAAINNGLGIEVLKARKRPINDRIRFLCMQMACNQYHIMRQCKHTIEALQTACWDAKRKTEDVRLDNGTSNIDSLDALEYSYEQYMYEMTEWGFSK